MRSMAPTKTGADTCGRDTLRDAEKSPAWLFTARFSRTRFPEVFNFSAINSAFPLGAFAKGWPLATQKSGHSSGSSRFEHRHRRPMTKGFGLLPFFDTQRNLPSLAPGLNARPRKSWKPKGFSRPPHGRSAAARPCARRLAGRPPMLRGVGCGPVPACPL